MVVEIYAITGPTMDYVMAMAIRTGHPNELLAILIRDLSLNIILGQLALSTTNLYNTEVL